MESQARGIGGALMGTFENSVKLQDEKMGGAKPKNVVLVNRAGESRSPYVRSHATNPVAWQMWGNEAISLAREENRLLFVSIGYSACHCKFLLPSLHGLER